MSWGLFSDRKFIISSNSTSPDIGPGKYNVESKHGPQKEGFAPFGSLVTENSKNSDETPDPGQYEAKPIDDYPTRKYIFSSKAPRKVFSEKTISPGPAFYQHLDDWIPETEAPHHSKLMPDSRPTTGFVGQDVDGFKVDQNGTTHPVPKKFKTSEDIGPGSYEPFKLPDPTPISIRSMADRNLYGKQNDFPGPGAYSCSEHSRHLGHRIVSRPKERKVEDEGPQFLPPDTWTEKETLSRSVFKSRTERGIFPPGEETPDPGAYEGDNDLTAMIKFPVSRAQTAFGFRTDRLDFWSPSETPGPGTYNPRDVKWIKKGQKPGRHAVDKNKVDRDAPGPGSYELQSKRRDKKPSSVFMTRTKRSIQDGRGEDTPGPGQYTCPFSSSKVPIKMNKMSRFGNSSKWISTSSAPPVGSYNPKYEDSSKGKTISRIGHRPLYTKNSNPGPGKYEIVHKDFLRHSYNSSIPI